MASSGSRRAFEVWSEFDRVVAEAPLESPWTAGDGVTDVGTSDGRPAEFKPDLDVLRELLWIPLRRGSTPQSGLPAKALDVWIAHELRRAGFLDDEIWPRASRPRVLSSDIAALIKRLPRRNSEELQHWLTRNTIRGAVASDAVVLGRAYLKQVDVLVAHWSRGPEIMISTKRMDSSFSNNTANRIEETYGDGKNLRGRHPLAALGYLMCVRSTILTEAPAVFEKLANLLEIMANEDDAYDATGLLLVDWPNSDATLWTSTELVIDQDHVPAALRIERFLANVIDVVLARCPVALHTEVRKKRNGERLAVAGRPADKHDRTSDDENIEAPAEVDTGSLVGGYGEGGGYRVDAGLYSSTRPWEET